MGYVFSPFVMSRLNTRPQFIAALIISAVAQVSITLITDWVILCQSQVTIMAIDCVLSIVMPTNTTKGHCTSGWDGPLSDNALPHTLLALPHHCRSSLPQLSNSYEKCILSLIRSHLRPGCRACSFCHHVGSFPSGGQGGSCFTS